MSHYIGSANDVARIRRLTQQREEAKLTLDAARDKMDNDDDDGDGQKLDGGGGGGGTGVGVGFETGAVSAKAVETDFSRETVGLVTREEFMQKRSDIETRIISETKRKKLEEDERKRKAKRKRRAAVEKREKKLLSFGDDDDDDGTGGDDEDAMKGDGEKSTELRIAKVGKDPGVDTSFLPDEQREKRDEERREELKRKWKEQDARARNEPVKITYSFWDGAGHRREIEVRKGDTVGAFLGKARAQLAPDFREMRVASVENMLYVKEDLILPHHLSFFDLIINKARGKSGPLFHFDVHDDIRLSSNATLEKDESHAGKVVERHWYEKNKHIFPASRWEVFEFGKNYGSYTIGSFKMER